MRCLPALVYFINYTVPIHAFASAQVPLQHSQIVDEDPLLPRSDPLASINASFGHTSPRSFVMPVTPSTSDSNTSQLAFQNSDNHLQWNYEVNRPTRILSNTAKSHTIELATRSFAHSYGKPLVKKYSPNLLPKGYDDPNQWVFIELSLSGNVSGRQFDRLGSIQLDGVEVLRTDNPEPSKDGVKWFFTKEMNKYFDLWRKERTVVFDFPNIVNDVYTGALNMTLSFTVYIASSDSNQLAPLSSRFAKVFPLSKKLKDENSFFNLGEKGGNDDGISRLRFPINAKSALVEIYASGTANDEFWYTNVPDRFYKQIGPKATKFGLFPRGPLREIQLWIDDMLAGVVYPFPVIFTGGISPFFWRPQVAYGAYNQPTYQIDITPFIGLLTDDKDHKFQFKVISAEANKTILNWFVSGNIQIELDSSQRRTIGSIKTHDAPSSGDYDITGHVEPDFNKTESLHFQVQGPRAISITAMLQPGSSTEPFEVCWHQNIYYDNTNRLQGNISHTEQMTTGQSKSTHNGNPFFQEDFSFSLTLESIQYDYTLKQEYDQKLVYGHPTLYKEPRTQHTLMTQKGKANMILDKDGHVVGGHGHTEVDYSYRDNENHTYTQNNVASNGTISRNEVGGTLKGKAVKV